MCSEVGMDCVLNLHGWWNALAAVAQLSLCITGH